MNNKTENFWNIKNEHLKNLIFFVAILIIILVAIISSSMFTGLINVGRLLINNPELRGLRLRAVAFNQINISKTWNLVNDVLRGILIIILIKLINRIFNKSNLSLNELGFHIEVKQVLYILIGFTLMSAMFISSLFINTDSDTVLNSLRTAFSNNAVFILILAALANAFWQEVVFRGFFQKRLIDSFGILTGIVMCAFLFGILHGLEREITLMELIVGTVLFTLVGVIYYLSNSIIFITAIHAAGNFFLRLYDTNGLYIPEQKYRLIVYSIVLIVVLVINKNKLFQKNKQIEGII